MAFIGCLGNKAVIPRGEKILMNVRKRLFEFREQNESVWIAASISR